MKFSNLEGKSFGKFRYTCAVITKSCNKNKSVNSYLNIFFRLLTSVHYRLVDNNRKALFKMLSPRDTRLPIVIDVK